jgi:predicted secreted protein
MESASAANESPVMTWPLGVAIYLTIWWVTLFAVLPFGVRSQHEGRDYSQGTDPGAPIAPGLLKKAIWTTGISALLFAALWYAMAHENPDLFS